MQSNGAEPLGLLEDAETLVEDGFLQCQLYMIERKGERKASSAYACGPRHGLRYFAQVVNTAGNYRKHRAEWSLDETKLDEHAQRILGILRDAGVVEDEFRLTSLLHHLTAPGAARFTTIVPRLIEWRDAFDRLAQPHGKAATSYSCRRSAAGFASVTLRARFVEGFYVTRATNRELAPRAWLVCSTKRSASSAM